MLIGLSGKRGVGKTLSAKYLSQFYQFKILSFAGPLKDIAKHFFPFDDKDFSDSKLKESPYKNYDWTPRDFLITLGEFGRYFDKNFWLKKVISLYLTNPSYNCVIDDVRFKNEADEIRRVGGYVVRINRQEALNIYGKNLDIPSETDLDNYNKFFYIIEDCTNTTRKNLCDQLDYVLDKIRDNG